MATPQPELIHVGRGDLYIGVGDGGTLGLHLYRNNLYPRRSAAGSLGGSLSPRCGGKH